LFPDQAYLDENRLRFTQIPVKAICLMMLFQAEARERFELLITLFAHLIS
jgi:hypothetical protein